MALVEIWVPILKRVQPLSPSGYSYHPDIPAGVAHTTDDVDYDRVAPVPVPFFSCFPILVDAADVEKCTARIDEKDVPERDKHFRDMLRHCRGDMTKAQAFFAALTADTKAKKDAIADVLAQAEARGMKKADADKVRSDKGISAAKQI